MFGRKSVLSLSLLLCSAVTNAFPVSQEANLGEAGLETRATSGMRAVGYFVNWAIYGRNYQPQQLPASQLTHVLYSFANIDSSSGTVELSDTYADLQKHYPTDSWNDVGNNVYGCVKQLFLLKQAHRNMKTLLSIGGYTYSPNFPGPLSTAAGRATFVNSSVTLLSDLGFDGLDIDYEYPANPQQAADFISLLQELRTALDSYAASVSLPKGTFLISVASPAGPANYDNMNLGGMDTYLDMWNLMAYDYAGPWSNFSGHDANFLPSSSNPNATPFNTQQAISYYESHGVAANKINLGVPLYGRSFTGTTGIGKPYTGVGQGTWAAGVYDWKALPPNSGFTSTDDTSVMGSYMYNPSTQELISYDSMNIMKAKANKAKSIGLGGLMWWETSADGNGTNSAIATQVGILAQSGMEQRQNTLSYPKSQYANLRAGFPTG